MTIGALNCYPFSYFESHPFIDLMKSAGEWNSTTYKQTNGLVDMPNGVTAITALAHQSSQGARLRTGTYVIKWTGAGTVAMDASTGVTASTPDGSNRATFTVTQTDPTLLTVRVTNTSGSAASATDIKVCHADREADMNSGEIFDPDFLSSLVGASVIRFMDWSGAKGMNGAGGVVNFSDWPTEAYQSWKNDTPTGTSVGCPPSIMGKLGTKLGLEIHVAIPTRHAHGTLGDVFQAIADEYPSGKIHVEFSNESWNTASGVYTYLKDTKATGLTIVDGDGNPSSTDGNKAACAMADGAAACWAAAENIFGRSRVVRVLAGQAANFNASKAAFEYTVATEPALALYGAVNIKTLLTSQDLYEIAPYFQMKATATIPAVTEKALCEQKAYTLTDAEWLETMQAYITDTVVPWITSNQTNLAAKSPDCLLSTYECGQHVTIGFEPASQYSVTVDDINNKLDSADDLTAGWEDGEQVYLDFDLFTALGISTRTPLVKLSGTTGLRLFEDQTAYDADAEFDMPAYALTQKIDNLTRMTLLDEKVKGIFNGDAGRTIYEAYYDDVFVGKLEHFNHYADTSGHIVNRGFQWGLKRSQIEDDTPRAAWFRTLAPVSTGLEQPLGGRGDNAGRARRRVIVKPTGIEPRRKTLTLPKKSPTPTERAEDSRVIQAEVAAQLATEFSAANAARSREIVVPISTMSLAAIEAEIAMLMRKKLRTEDDETMLLMLMISAVA